MPAGVRLRFVQTRDVSACCSEHHRKLGMPISGTLALGELMAGPWVAPWILDEVPVDGSWAANNGLP